MVPVPPRPSPWQFLPHLLVEAGILLLAAVGFALVQRPFAPRSRMSDHPANGLDDVVHQRVRLGILTVAHEARQVEFGYLRTSLGLTAGNLSQHLPCWRRPGW